MQVRSLLAQKSAAETMNGPLERRASIGVFVELSTETRAATVKVMAASTVHARRRLSARCAWYRW